MTKILKIVAFMALLHCGFTSSRVISTLYALHYGQPAWMVGVILSTYAAIPALISIHVGKFIDKIGVRIPYPDHGFFPDDLGGVPDADSFPV